MNTFTTLTSRVVYLPADDVDTDQIIPARFLKTTDKNGLADKLFADWRNDDSGKPRPDFALHDPAVQGAQVLLAGRNFGCGSSREHAPWALAAWGFRAIVAVSFADIFRSNALKNGLLPVPIEEAAHTRLVQARAKDPALQVTIDLPLQRLFAMGESFPFPIDAFSKTCLVQGVDELGYLLSFEDRIRAHEARR